MKISIALFVFFLGVPFFSCNDDKKGDNTKFSSGTGNASKEYAPPDSYDSDGNISSSANGDSLGTGDDPDAPDISQVDPDYNPREENNFRNAETEECVLDDQQQSGDFVNFPWPLRIKACYDSGLMYDFFANKCSTIPIVEGFAKTEQWDADAACDWDGAYAVQVDRIGIKSNPIGEAERNDFAKLVGCGEVIDSQYDMIILQYWYPTLADRQACKVVTNWRIYTSCRYRRFGHDVDMTWGECLQYQQQAAELNGY